MITDHDFGEIDPKPNRKFSKGLLSWKEKGMSWISFMVQRQASLLTA